MGDIVAATDLTERGAAAVARALAIATARGATLTVMHVVDAGLPPRLVDIIVREATNVVREQIAAAQKSGRAALDDVRMSVETGRHYEKIAERVAACGAELLVLGGRDPSPVRDMFFPATPERVLRLTETPVLVARTPPGRSFSRALAAVDFSLPARRAVETAATLFPETRFELVHAFDVPAAAWLTSEETKKRYLRELRALVRHEMDGFAERLGLGDRLTETVLVPGGPAEAILREAERRQSDLVVVGTHGRSGVGRALLGSVAQGVIAGARCDVLAVKGW